MPLAVPTPSTPVVTRHCHRRPPVAVATLLDIAAGLAAATDLQPPASPAGERSAVRLLATDAYEAWLLAWPPGSSIEPHDHGDAHGAFVVVVGEVVETRWLRTRPHRRQMRVGDSSVLRVGTVHDVAAAGNDAAVSVHVYSPPLSTMRYYDADGRRVTRVETVPPFGRD